MSQYPWGPHGPRVDGPPTTTPNPTSSWVHQPLGGGGGGWGGGGGGAGGGGQAQSTYVYTGPVGPRRKRWWIAIPLAWLFGPLGLLYAIGDSRPQKLLLLLFVGAAAAIYYANVRLPLYLVYFPHPILMTCVVWSIFATIRFNRRHRFD